MVRSVVSSVLEVVHNLEGHWQFRMTLRKLGHVYWPNMIKDIDVFIAGCLKCDKHGNAWRAQITSPMIIEGPNEL